MNLSLFFRTSCNLLCFLLVCFFSVAVGFSQESRTSTDSFDRIEARLQQMRSKFGAIGNRTSPSSTLLAPVSSRADNSPRSITRVQDSETSSPVSESEDNQDFPISKRAPGPSMASAFGDYYFQAFCGYVVPSDVRFNTLRMGDKMLEADSAYQFGVSGGKRFGNWMTDLQVSYGAMDYDGFVNNTFSYQLADGEGTSVDVALNLSYGSPIGDNAWIYVGLGAGCAFRDDRYLLVMSSGGIEDARSEATVFSYNAFLGVGYSFTDLMNLRLGYRYAGAGPNNKFGSIRNHVFEGSLGASF
jgi:opacity protein-like surface antigen